MYIVYGIWMYISFVNCGIVVGIYPSSIDLPPQIWGDSGFRLTFWMPENRFLPSPGAKPIIRYTGNRKRRRTAAL